jgi:hypothetical protein
MLLFNTFITGKLDKVFTVEQTIKETDESSQVVKICVLEFNAVFLLDIQEPELGVV